MARFKLAAPIEAIRGTVAGLTFSANKAGPFVRQWSQPVYKASILQAQKRSYTSFIRSDWKTLSQIQIDAWNALAADPPEIDYDPFGEQRYLSGCQWHSRINLRRLQAGQAIASAAPTNTPVDPPATGALTVYETSYAERVDTLDYALNEFQGFYLILHCGSSLSPVLQSLHRSHRAIWNAAPQYSDYTIITEPLETALGTLTTGQKIFARIFKQSTDGIRSTPILDSILVEPAP